jgi:hypothetical protein
MFAKDLGSHPLSLCILDCWPFNLSGAMMAVALRFSSYPRSWDPKTIILCSHTRQRVKHVIGEPARDPCTSEKAPALKNSSRRLLHVIFSNSSLICPGEPTSSLLPVPELQMEASSGSRVENMTWVSTNQHISFSSSQLLVQGWNCRSNELMRVRPGLWTGEEMLSFLLNWSSEDMN